MKKAIVIFGGSFNPPHNSHFAMAQQVLNEYQQVEKIVFVPVNKKYEKDGLIENIHRYNMLKQVIDKNSGFILSNIDLHENRSLSTIEIAEEIQKQYLNKEIWLCYLSATYVRNQIKQQKSIRYLVPDEVYEYIEKNQLYREG